MKTQFVIARDEDGSDVAPLEATTRAEATEEALEWLGYFVAEREVVPDEDEDEDEDEDDADDAEEE